MSIALTAFFNIRKTKSGAPMNDERHDSSANDTKADKGVYAAQVAKPKGPLTASLRLTDTRRLDSSQPERASAWDRFPISVVKSAVPLSLRPDVEWDGSATVTPLG
jgi:hypothetical protein